MAKRLPKKTATSLKSIYCFINQQFNTGDKHILNECKAKIIPG